jgi:hypothetical protein
MTSTCELFLRSVIRGHWWQAASLLFDLSSRELFYALAALDPLDRGELQKMYMLQRQPRVRYALDVVKRGVLPDARPTGVSDADVLAARIYVGHKCAHPESFPLERDLTGWMPPANPNPAPITDGDIRWAVGFLNVEEAIIRAVAEVESRGDGFVNGRPLIRFEQHIFRSGKKGLFAGTGGIYNPTHCHLSNSEDGGKQYHIKNPDHAINQPREYSLLHGALLLRDATGRRRYKDAWNSASWGRFQVMGFNHSLVGWNSIEEFVMAMCSSESDHLNAFVGYVYYHRLERHLRNHNWAAFTEIYNGPKYRDTYATLLERAYKRIKQKEKQQAA